MSGRQGHGNRLTGRTAKQQAQARHYTNTHAVLSPPEYVASPEGSWWAQTLTWDEFDAAADRESARMRDSRFGGYRGNGMREQD